MAQCPCGRHKGLRGGEGHMDMAFVQGAPVYGRLHEAARREVVLSGANEEGQLVAGIAELCTPMVSCVLAEDKPRTDNN